MIDRRSGFYKIGESRKPEYRERTLQADTPLVDLIQAWAGSAKDERNLHRMFAEKRLRGEWFRLDDESDVERVYAYFDGCERYDNNDLMFPQATKHAREMDRRCQEIAYEADWYDYVTEGWGIEF